MVKIYKVDITETNPSVVEFYTLGSSDDYSIQDIKFKGNDMYIASSPAIEANDKNKVLKLSMSEVLSTNTFENKAPVKLYPNPSSDYINVSGLQESKDYAICNLLGATVLEGEVSQNQNIDVKSLQKGLYIIKLENNEAIKFMKK